MTANTLRIGIAPVTAAAPDHELGVLDSVWSAPLEHLASDHSHTVSWGHYSVRIEASPLTVTVLENGKIRQQIRFEDLSTNIHFPLDGPIFGLGEGTDTSIGAALEKGSKRAGPPITAHSGRGCRFPGSSVRRAGASLLASRKAISNSRRPKASSAASKPHRRATCFCCWATGPADVLNEYARLTGFPHMPPRWALGYLQSHRTLASREEVLDVLKTFREKKLPCDGVIYLGTGFCPSGWNTGHGSFIFNEKVFPDPPAIIQADSR